MMPDSTEPHLPWVSIVIPAYNHADYLDAAIQSVFNQDYLNIELIVLDDNSTEELVDDTVVTNLIRAEFDDK